MEISAHIDITHLTGNLAALENISASAPQLCLHRRPQVESTRIVGKRPVRACSVGGSPTLLCLAPGTSWGLCPPRCLPCSRGATSMQSPTMCHHFSRPHHPELELLLWPPVPLDSNLVDIRVSLKSVCPQYLALFLTPNSSQYIFACLCNCYQHLPVFITLSWVVF